MCVHLATMGRWLAQQVTVLCVSVLTAPLPVLVPLVSWKVTTISVVTPVSWAMKANIVKGAPWAIMGTLKHEVAVARSVTATRMALSMATVTAYLGSAFAGWGPRGSGAMSVNRGTF